MMLKWFKRTIAIGGSVVLILLAGLWLYAQTQNGVIGVMASLVVFVVLLDTHLRQVARDQNRRIARRQP